MSVHDGIVDRDRAGAEQSLSHLRSRLRRSMKELARSEFSLLQIEIVEELLSGRRTVAELVEAIYSISRGHEGFATHYSRVRREIRQLESKGFVVPRKLFGRDKPYALTQLAVAKLTRIEGVEPGQSQHVVPRMDYLVYLGAILLWIVASTVLGASGHVSTIVVAAFFFTSGIAFCRFLQTVRRVI